MTFKDYQDERALLEEKIAKSKEKERRDVAAIESIRQDRQKDARLDFLQVEGDFIANKESINKESYEQIAELKNNCSRYRNEITRKIRELDYRFKFEQLNLKS